MFFLKKNNLSSEIRLFYRLLAGEFLGRQCSLFRSDRSRCASLKQIAKTRTALVCMGHFFGGAR